MSPTEKRLRQLERILEVNLELVSTVELTPLLNRIASIAAELTESVEASILLLDEQSGDLRFCAAANRELASRLEEIPVPVQGSIAGVVLRERRPLIVANAAEDPRHFREVGARIGFQTRSMLAVPLQAQGRCIGVLEAVNKRDPAGFTQEDVEILTALAAQATVAIENARLVEALRAAYHKLGELDRLKIETMLNLRYLETGEMVLYWEVFDLREEIVRSCEVYHSLAEAGKLSLECHLPDDPLFVRADREKIRLVLDNLLSNAVKFTPEGGRVKVHAVHRPDTAEVIVSDTGVGIPQDALQRIFERFYQAEDPMTRRHGGMGLGLSIVREMVERHGGRVWAESTPGQGSRFIVRLPLCTPSC